MPELPETEQYFNRELSWLAFNRRVLEEALSPETPPLERLKFLAIASSNLDEFFMVRVGGLQLLVDQGKERPDHTGLSPQAQLQAISEGVRRMVEEQYDCLLKEVEPQLAAAGLKRLRLDELTPDLYEYLEGVFEKDLYPVLSPVAVTGPSDLPMLPGLTLHLAVRFKTSTDARKARFAIITLPRRLGRFITLPIEQGHNYVTVEDVAGAFIERMFPGEPVAEWTPFRITRNADMSVREDLAADLLSGMKDILSQRKQSDSVRLELSATISRTLRTFLQATLEAPEEHTYAVPGPLDLSAFFGIARMTGFDALRDKPWPPQAPTGLKPNESLFDVLARGDVILYHPYDSFDPVVRLIEQAADDPDVLAIKQVLYRTSENSPIVAALARAANREKHVTVIVELKARFDEARNIGWAEALEQSGVQVIYGLKGLKTHAKICIIVRREAGGIRRYVHFGTGNYNEITARLYSDVSYMTCQEDYGADATAFFNMITGYSQPVPFRKIEAAPLGLRARLLELIDSETERCRQGQEARIMAKINALVDSKVIQALYRASQAGVKIQLNVRGVCCLRPGVPNLSENIAVTSIVDRFLEHARILYFHQGGEPLVFISSADWMPRNLDRRVELLVPVDDEAGRNRLIDILNMSFRDNVQSRRLESDGSYTRRRATGPKAFRAQEVFYLQAVEAVHRAQKNTHVVFEPQRPTPVVK